MLRPIKIPRVLVCEVLQDFYPERLGSGEPAVSQYVLPSISYGLP